MSNAHRARGGRPRAAVGGFLVCVAALTAAANSHYDSGSLNGNLQNQCTSFAASVAAGTSFVVAAECNEAASPAGGVAASRNSTSFDLSGEVGWDTSSQTFSWDATLSGTMKDIADECEKNGSSPFTYSASDVTLALTCATVGSDGVSGTANVSLALNGNLRANVDGDLVRR